MIGLVNVLVVVMKSEFIVIGLISSFSIGSLANDIRITTPVDEKEVGCSSVVCKNIIAEKSVSKAGDFPERTGNETFSAIGNVLFVVGEMGLAENLQEDNVDHRVMKHP